MLCIFPRIVAERMVLNMDEDFLFPHSMKTSAVHVPSKLGNLILILSM